jgi:hypothetical protein
LSKESAGINNFLEELDFVTAFSCEENVSGGGSNGFSNTLMQSSSLLMLLWLLDSKLSYPDPGSDMSPTTLMDTDLQEIFFRFKLQQNPFSYMYLFIINFVKLIIINNIVIIIIIL